MIKNLEKESLPKVENNYFSVDSKIVRPAVGAIARNTQIRIEDLEKLDLPLEFDGENIVVKRSANNYRLISTVRVPIAQVLAVREAKLVDYIFRTLLAKAPSLIPYTFDNQSLIELANHLLRDCSGSLRTYHAYAVSIRKYATWLGHSPDSIIQDLLISEDGEADKKRAKTHRDFLIDFYATLQDSGLTPGSYNADIRALHTFYSINNAKSVRLNKSLKKKTTYKDRAPTAEEIIAMLDISEVRDAFIIAALCSAGLREETLSVLKYRHVKTDLEANRIPLHIHVEVEITKGKYHDYDTFLNAEAIYYLKLYLASRKLGSRCVKPEILTDESPLIRNKARTEKVLPASRQMIYQTVHRIALAAGVTKKLRGSRMYDVRTHSLRKYFKSQLSACQINDDIIEYMMGHSPDTYEDVQSLGIEKLRNLYRTANLTIRPKVRANKIEQLKEIIRAWGENPEQILSQDALNRADATNQTAEETENREISLLAKELKEILKREVK